MKIQAYAPDPLNEQASVLVDAQTDIKIAIKQGVLSGAPSFVVKQSIERIVARAIARIRSPTLQKDARISLMRFADGAYRRFNEGLRGITPAALPALVVLMRAVTARENQQKYFVPKSLQERKAVQVLSERGLTFETGAKGIPLQEFQKKYIDRVSEALYGLAEENALDPNDFTGRNSLRSLAEMQVRYERHQDEIAGIKSKGAKLVVCSVHGDCSDRCARWQGGVYSLDGTSGTTEDGRKYQPLENATDIFYTTKAGRTYKNGLLGFNCRHKLFEYRTGMGIPSISKEEQKREYAVTKRQRELERGVVSAREIALCFKDVGGNVYRKWNKIARKRYEAYKQFSKDNGRAYYPDRVKIL